MAVVARIVIDLGAARIGGQREYPPAVGLARF
jgi:hypothetical protein